MDFYSLSNYPNLNERGQTLLDALLKDGNSFVEDEDVFVKGDDSLIENKDRLVEDGALVEEGEAIECQPRSQQEGLGSR